jgi:hypothetical protein
MRSSLRSLAILNESGPAPAEHGATDIRRVALGPSVSQWRNQLQDQLGRTWFVADLMSETQSSTPFEVTVLGTPEIPVDAVQVTGHGVRTCVLVGILRSAPATTAGGAVRESRVVYRLANVLRTLVARLPPATPAAA